MDKDLKFALKVMLIVIIILAIMMTPIFVKLNKSEKLIKQACEERNLEICFTNAIVCFDTCGDLDLTYLKYDGTGFGSGECWCYDANKNSIQVY